MDVIVSIRLLLVFVALLARGGDRDDAQGCAMCAGRDVDEGTDESGLALLQVKQDPSAGKYSTGSDGSEIPREIRTQALKLAAEELAKASNIANAQVRNVEVPVQGGRVDMGRLGGSPAQSTSSPPPDAMRVSTHYADCSCGDGLSNVTFWPGDDMEQHVSVSAQSVRWVGWGKVVRKVSWICSGMSEHQSMYMHVGRSQWLSLQVIPMAASESCKDGSAQLKWNVWSKTDYVSSVPFTTNSEGYACIKIPALLRTSNGTFIAFAEARTPDCDDFARTDLVYKRSIDGGRTWSELKVLVEVDGDPKKQGVCGHDLVIGNVAPVQIEGDASHHPGRILAPYTRNNFKTWITYSDDDGETWSASSEIPHAQYTLDEPDCTRNMSHFGFPVDKLTIRSVPYLVEFVAQLCYRVDGPWYKAFQSTLSGPWQFVGTGPPGSLQLRSGRIVVPAYHSYIRGLDSAPDILPISQLFNNFALGHVLISDDGGDTWHMSDEWGIGQGTNENQMVQLSDGSVLSNSRSLSTGSLQRRVQSISQDEGESFGASAPIGIPQPFNGCQGSTVGGEDPDTIYVANPDPSPSTSLIQKLADMLKCEVSLTGRERVTVWKSTDGGKTYPTKTLVDPGSSAQTSLQYGNGKLFLLHEQTDPKPITFDNVLQNLVLGKVEVLLPSRFVFREVTA